MSSHNTLVRQVEDAYEHLYDVVHLRTHPLTELLPDAGHLTRNERAWQLHHYLVGLIGELDPGSNTPPYSREWRRHRLMVMRYIDQLKPHQVADRLAISLRSYYRECAAAIEALAELLWDRQERDAHSDEQTAEFAVHPAPVNRLELLRLEAARSAQAGREAQLGEVLDNAVQLVQEMARGKGIHVRWNAGAAPLAMAVARSVLRQILIGVLSYLVECLDRGEISVSAATDAEAIALTFGIEGQRDGRCGDNDSGRTHLAVLNELATAQKYDLRPFMDHRGITGFALRLPLIRQHTVLVVDDNEDTLQLFRGYLTQHDYQVTTARTGAEALESAKTLQPFAITLDLMMPLQDGWEILQALTNHPATEGIPVIICTVLSAKELALSLGASSFLAKPVSEQALLAALQALEGN